MDLRQLRYFATVAEELHFSRAAARLHLSQSALSAQVRQLEEELGGPLLIRTTRRVELTPAGETLLEHAHKVLASVDEAITNTRAVARGEGGALVVGSMGPAPGGLLAPLLAQFGVQHPRVSVELRAFDFHDTVRGLREHRADVAFLYDPLDEPDLVTTRLLSEERVVILPTRHRLARRRYLRPSDLRKETFITQPANSPPRWRDFWLLVEENGERPPISPHIAANIVEWLHLIARGEGLDTCPAIIARYYSWPEVSFVPLIEATPATLVLVRHVDSIQPLIHDFTRLAVSVARTAAANPNTPYFAAV